MWQFRENRSEAESQWIQLINCGSDQLPQMLDQIQRNTRIKNLIVSRTRQGYIDQPNDIELRYRAGLVLLEHDKSVVADICRGWLDSYWWEWNWIKRQLRDRDEEVRKWLQQLDASNITSLNEHQLARLSAIIDVVSFDIATAEAVPSY